MTVAVACAKLLSLPHGFLGRSGGVSAGPITGLNVGLGAGDNPLIVAENRRRAVEAVAPKHALVTVYQVHSSLAVNVTGPFKDEARPHADAMVTNQPGLVLGILTADCAPVLLADCKAGVIGASHAGWKGALSGVTDATVQLMEQLGACRDRIVAAVGPCIARGSYEVDTDFLGRFMVADPVNERFFAASIRPGHCQFDLEAYVVHRLKAAGVTQIEALGLDTCSDAEGFFSFRRSTHRSEPSYGRQMSLIALP